MPTVRANDIDIYYEEYGSGEPLLLIMGWGGNAASWKPQLPGLAEQYRVIAFDNRGVGRTSAPEDRYSTRQMACDTVGLLDAIEVPRAHVFGVSMGGMIAQELALGHPERVGALILGCTSPGGDRATGFAELRLEIETFRQTGDDGVMNLEWFAEFMKLLWTDGALTRSDSQVQDFVLSLIRFPPAPHGLRNQGAAIAAHDTHDRLPVIRHRTLVIAGADDLLIDPRNSLILAVRIPDAQLHIFPDLKHAFHLERPDIVNSVIVDFIQRVRQSATGAAPAAGLGEDGG